ncbi:MAG: HAMP domain-containing protein [Proteobacteria bacterium]|nr:HAMP domain-containing protein [Pseudomonadota bacterium]MBU4295538.1 HAMP domain-containing protein [Pseudomonadota bacterium]MCG2748414.1 ATP-binding protein [Desulfobulbaceae bacterium]
MKKKIIISFLLLFLLFLAGIVITLHIINKTTANLTALLLLHKVEVIRQDLVINVQTVQSNLYTTGTSFGKELDIIVDNVLKLRSRAQTCTDCHHDPPVENEIIHLQELTEQYQEALSYFITSTADSQRIKRLQAFAADIGDRIIEKSQWMAMTANDALRKKTTAAMDEVADSKKILTMTLAFAFLLGIVISLYFIKSITSPVAALLGATRKIKSGKLQYRIEGKLNDEFCELAESFNEMADSLQEQYNKLQETERLAVVGELAAGMAHEIKNPMAGIKVSMEVLMQDSPLDGEDKEVLHRVINEIDRITALLKGLLNYARPPKPEMVSLDVNQVLEATLKSARYALQTPRNKGKEQDRKIEFVKDFGSDIPHIVADPGQLQQVFLNLILNAVDATASITGRQGVITIRTRQSPDGFVQISIADNGKGIDGKLLEKIFNPFYTTKPQGTGLGLAITKRLIEQHGGGSIAVANNPWGEGLTFTITLPVEPKSGVQN